MSRDTGRSTFTQAVFTMRQKMLEAIGAGSEKLRAKLEDADPESENAETIIPSSYPGLSMALTSVMNEAERIGGVKFTLTAGPQATGGDAYTLDLTCMLNDDGSERWDMNMGGPAFKEMFEAVKILRNELGRGEMTEMDILHFATQAAKEHEQYF